MDKLPNFKNVRVLVVGDVMLDVYLEGEVTRISPEAPVPVVKAGTKRYVPGGAANVAMNIVALGGRATLISQTGKDTAGERLRMALFDGGVNFILPAYANSTTTTKMRVTSNGHHIVRVDTEDTEPRSDSHHAWLVDATSQVLLQSDVVIISDYCKGFFGGGDIFKLIQKAKDLGKKVVVDSKSTALQEFQGATVCTPNLHELLAATDRSKEDVQGAVNEFLRRGACEAVLVTMAEKGVLLRNPYETLHIPAHSHEVVDVVGAGDTVVATLALGLGAGMDVESSARLANTAAGVVVGKVGTATVSREELEDALRAEHRDEDPLARARDKCMGPGLLEQVAKWKAKGLRVGFTNGCFDILHTGHLNILEYAKGACDKLIVGLNSDDSVTLNKGPGRPILPYTDRALMLAGLRSVDVVTPFEGATPEELIKEIVPDVLIKGGDYAGAKIVGQDIVEAAGGCVVLCPTMFGKSTTALANKLEKLIKES